MRRTKYIPSEHLLRASQELRDDYNYFVRHLVQQSKKETNQRYVLAEKYLREGMRGVEIGGFHTPNHLPKGCQADYIDQVSIDEIKKRFPQFDDFNCVYPLILDHGEEVSKVETEHYDFLIANHMLEHAENAIKTIQNHLRIIKPNGYILYAIPDKHATFDSKRELTTYKHLEDEYFNGPEKNRRAHYIDVVTNVDHHATTPELFDSRIETMMQEHLDTHFHVWDFASFHDHINQMIANKLIHARLIEIVPNGIEFICVLQKLPL